MASRDAIACHVSPPGPDQAGTPELEVEHVQRLYDRIARSWHGTRYKAWPRVEAFARAVSRSSLIADVGAGNGKNLPACARTGAPGAEGFSMPIASDISFELAKIVAERRYEVAAADITALPFREGVFDALLCIAVLHHISTRERRERACAQCVRLLRPGGRALFYAWAQEQEAEPSARGADGAPARVDTRAAPADARAGAGLPGGYSGHRFATQDVLVPFHVPLRHVDAGVRDAKAAATEAPAAAGEAGAAHGSYDAARQTIVFQRYCHVYCRGELEALFAPLVASGEAVLEQSYYDCGNWCAIVSRAAPPLSGAKRRVASGVDACEAEAGDRDDGRTAILRLGPTGASLE
jgi:alkylated DNA repair protein alkB family protein 8